MSLSNANNHEEASGEEDFSRNVDRDGKEIKKSMTFKQDDAGTIVYAIAIHAIASKNKLTNISCVEGEFLNYEAFNYVEESYHTKCFSSHLVGVLPVNYRVCIKDSHWEVNVPLPSSAIKRYMTKDQKIHFDKWLESMKNEKITVHYLQLLGVF
jgi:hypothetical protein